MVRGSCSRMRYHTTGELSSALFSFGDVLISLSIMIIISYVGRGETNGS